MNAVEERFWAKTRIDGDCLVWTGFIDRYGYGVFRDGPKTVRAHRYALALAGPIPRMDERGRVLSVDHLCRNRACVNPHHLELVTHRENTLRGNTLAARMAAKTHCPAGHAYQAPNLIIDAQGKRRCRACRRNRAAGGTP